MSLLWETWLIAGPSYFDMRRFLDSVTSVCTDYGTERIIPDFPDVLPDFLRYIGVHVPAKAETREFLMPSAVLNPGWNHARDGVLRVCLCSLPWFAVWLAMI
jgi:hypothetical protein